MNERIKELAEQAGLKYYNWINNESNVNNGDFKYPRFEDYEKFAELIVMECANEILKWKSEPFPLDPDFAAKIIKEHFEIK